MASKETMTEDDICQHIRDSVLEQRLAPGTKLTEESLCGIFGVGRTTIRRAFLLLSKDHIIELQRNKGAIVASPTPHEAREVFEARAVLESALLEKAVAKASADDIEALKAHLKTEDDALKRADIVRWIRLTGEFHLKVAEIAQNKPLYGFLERLVFQTSLIISLYGQQANGPNCKGDDHEKMVEAIAEHNYAAANDILLHHLETIEGQLKFTSKKGMPDLQQIFSRKAAF